MRPVPYPSDIEAKGWRLELDYERIESSDTWKLALRRGLQPYLLMLWHEAWKQSPVATLPNDDDVLAAIIGMEPEQFAAAKPILMRNWSLAEDGRLYHETLTEMVLRLWKQRTVGAYRRFREAVIRKHGEACIYCGSAGPLTLYHVIPRSRGGLDIPENLVPACLPCNSSKGARTPSEWRAHERG